MIPWRSMSMGTKLVGRTQASLHYSGVDQAPELRYHQCPSGTPVSVRYTSVRQVHQCPPGTPMSAR